MTGSKNSIKGFGFLSGAVLLGQFGFVAVLYAMASILCAILFVLCVAMPQGRKNAQFSDVWSDNSNINWLALSRIFLFGARDVWFVVAIPIYFYSVLSDGTPDSNRSAFFAIGTVMAL